MTKPLKTYYASPERSDFRRPSEEIERIKHDAQLKELLGSTVTFLAVLNQHRQVLALNDSFLKLLGISHSNEVLGLRLGETLQCPNFFKMEGECGTSKDCISCGAFISIVGAQSSGHPVDAICTVSAIIQGKACELLLKISARPITLSGERCVLISLSDVVVDEQLEVVERSFYHDISNIIQGLAMAAEMAAEDLSETEMDEIIEIIRTNTSLLARNVEIQRYLSNSKFSDFRLKKTEYALSSVFSHLKAFYEHHPAMEGKRLEFGEFPTETQLHTDMALLSRVLCNMITNALEASLAEQPVRFWIEQKGDVLEFCVRNEALIPEQVADRLFECRFSTKEGSNRGLGTCSMKLLGEQLLGGKVSFTSIEPEGTTFRLTLRNISS